MEKNQTMTDEQLARELQNGKRGGGRGKLLTVIGCAATAIGIFTSVTALTVIGIVVALLGQGVLNKHRKATGNTVSKRLVALRSSASDNRLLRLYQNGSKTPENQGFPGFYYI